MIRQFSFHNPNNRNHNSYKQSKGYWFQLIDSEFGSVKLTTYSKIYNTFEGHLGIIYLEYRKRGLKSLPNLTKYTTEYLHNSFLLHRLDLYTFSPTSELVGFNFRKQYLKCLKREVNKCLKA